MMMMISYSYHSITAIGLALIRADLLIPNLPTDLPASIPQCWPANGKMRCTLKTRLRHVQLHTIFKACIWRVHSPALSPAHNSPTPLLIFADMNTYNELLRLANGPHQQMFYQ
jgi:hypothetical protein